MSREGFGEEGGEVEEREREREDGRTVNIILLKMVGKEERTLRMCMDDVLNHNLSAT